MIASSLWELNYEECFHSHNFESYHFMRELLFGLIHSLWYNQVISSHHLTMNTDIRKKYFCLNASFH